MRGTHRSITRDCQATVFSGCHDNSDVSLNNSLPKLFIFSEFSVYFIFTYMHKRISMSQGILRRFAFT